MSSTVVQLLVELQHLNYNYILAYVSCILLWELMN